MELSESQQIRVISVYTEFRRVLRFVSVQNLSINLTTNHFIKAMLLIYNTHFRIFFLVLYFLQFLLQSFSNVKK